MTVAQFDRFEDFEVVDHLATVSELDVFGSELDLTNPTTQFPQDQTGMLCMQIRTSLSSFESVWL